ncbi:esterase-like activity of phytase family protein [Polyangium aurulentum]|uniref:esterase-like activity of phytase family protein n=1 Tax=Polyangium aurulentum TaxID=2567896 RepID=UPI00146C27B2|nr:esterase-like activity of phytase family protein [Polyangium aurulentum]UQA61212.1 esterase-like activity of phytase family protein [Polyangium aurulentum]
MSSRQFLAAARLLATLLLAAACDARPSAPAGPTPAARIEKLPIDDVAGLSGLAADDRGSLWSVPEDRPMLVEIPASGAPRSMPLRGVPDGLELESLAWLGGDRFAAGTEGGCGSGAERILLILREGGEARVERALDLPLALWGGSCDEHHGIEGLCHAGGKLVAAIEHVIVAGGGRLAPLARVDPQNGEATAYRLALTSDTGKISALDCRARGDAIEVLAVERHFEVSRLVGFSLPASGPASDAPVRPRVLAELGAHTNGGKRNFEGVVWLDDRRAALIVDNQYRGITGPNEIVRVDLPAP